MQLIILCSDREDPIVLEVPEDSDVSLVQQLACGEAGLNFAQYYLELDGLPLPLDANLLSVGVFDGSMLLMKTVSQGAAVSSSSSTAPSVNSNNLTPQKRAATSTTSATTPSVPAPQATSSSSSSNRSVSLYDIPADIKPDDLMALVHQHAHLLKQFQEQDPELAETLVSKDLPKLRALMMKRFMNKHKMIYQQKQDLMALEQDPMNPDLQKKIEEAVSYQHFSPSFGCALSLLLCALC